MNLTKSFPLLAAVLLLLAGLAACSGSDGHDSKYIPEQELHALDAAIAANDTYYSHTKSRLRNMEARASKLHDPAQRGLAYAELANQVRFLDADSAINIADVAISNARQSGVDSVVTLAHLSRVNALTSAGIFNIAEREFLDITEGNLSPQSRLAYWEAGRNLYSTLQLYTQRNYDLSQKFARQAMAYDDTLIRHLPERDAFRSFLVAERLVVSGDNQKAKRKLEALMKSVDPNSNIYGMAAYQMALVYKNLDDERSYAAYMAKAAQANVRQSVREGLALFNLANWLYAQGELNKAFGYINFAMGQANDANARMRTANIATMLPLIDDAYRAESKTSHDMLIIYFVILALALFILGGMFFYILMQSKRGKENARKLRELSQAQKRHIANFLALCSTYYHKLNSLEQLVQRKISSGQTDQLVKLLKSGRYTEDKEDEIFKYFDRTFVEIFPDFIEQINLLLRPEERFPTEMSKKGLPLELRIYALVKLGITESTRIAQVLNYSVNTVYSYRNRMRNKAIDREHFEQQVVDFQAEHES